MSIGSASPLTPSGGAVETVGGDVALPFLPDVAARMASPLDAGGLAALFRPKINDLPKLRAGALQALRRLKFGSENLRYLDRSHLIGHDKILYVRRTNDGGFRIGEASGGKNRNHALVFNARGEVLFAKQMILPRNNPNAQAHTEEVLYPVGAPQVAVDEQAWALGVLRDLGKAKPLAVPVAPRPQGSARPYGR